MMEWWKKTFYIGFGIASVVCFSAEVWEITWDISIYWSDHLHNMLDHIVFLMINIMAMKLHKQ